MSSLFKFLIVSILFSVFSIYYTYKMILPERKEEEVVEKGPEL